MYKRVENSEERMRNFYMVTQVIGTGSFGKVYRIIHKETNEEFALKSINKSLMDQDQLANLQLEIEILSQVDHPNIVKTYEIYDEPEFLHCIMENMKGGELFDRIVEKDCYGEREAANTILHVLDAVRYCHQMGVVHRDLKPENLLYSDDGPAGIVKINDFGIARFYDDDVMTTACGTPGYIAPEILHGRGYGTEVDCWSIGVILYIMLCGFPPFSEDTNEALFETIKRGEFDFPAQEWTHISDTAKDLISRCLQVDPAQRITIREMIEHEWIVSGNTPRNNLPAVMDEIKRYNLRRKFRRAAHAAIAANKLLELARITKSERKNSE